MNSKSPQMPDLEELNSKKRTLKNMTIVVVVLILLYGAYFISEMASGTWQANTSIATLPIFVLVIASALLSTRSSQIAKEIESRTEKDG